MGSKSGKDREEPSKPVPGDQAAADAKEQDDYLEEALEETFPASDPISPGHVEKKND